MGIFKKTKEIIDNAADKVEKFVKENKPELKDVGIMLGAVAIGSFLAGGAVILGMKAADAATAKWNTPTMVPLSNNDFSVYKMPEMPRIQSTDMVRVSVSAPASFLKEVSDFKVNLPTPELPIGGA